MKNEFRLHDCVVINSYEEDDKYVISLTNDEDEYFKITFFENKSYYGEGFELMATPFGNEEVCDDRGITLTIEKDETFTTGNRYLITVTAKQGRVIKITATNNEENDKVLMTLTSNLYGFEEEIMVETI